MISPPLHLPRIEISLDNLLHNLAQLRSRLLPGQRIMAVVKDCAYGCSALPVARALEAEGTDFFAVARTSEARHLRENGITAPILVLGQCSLDETRWASANNVRLSINDIEDVARYAAAQAPLSVHINIDTGMGRMGVLDTEAADLSAKLADAPSLHIEALYSHFASADVAETGSVSLQLRRFESARSVLAQRGISVSMVHLANSAAIARFPTTDAGYVRPGIALYGCSPDPAQDFGMDLRPVASLKAHIVKMKKLPAGSPVSYGGHYITPRDTYIATVPVGYAHGLPRLLSGTGDVLVGGKRYRIAGNVTMDYIMLDAGAAPEIQLGDEVVAIGYQGEQCIHPDEVARQCQTIGYEILCGLNTRIDRYYYRCGQMVLHEPAVLY